MTKLEQSIRDLGKKHGFYAVSIGINADCIKEHQWAVNVHWKGYSRDGNPCVLGYGETIAEALKEALAAAEYARVPPEARIDDKIADEALPVGA